MIQNDKCHLARGQTKRRALKAENLRAQSPNAWYEGHGTSAVDQGYIA